jgi:uncharacterized membrane protein
MSTKTTVAIPERLLTSIPIAIPLAIFIVYILHLFGEWKSIAAEVDWSAPEHKGAVSIAGKQEAFWNTCSIIDASHYVKLPEQTLDWQKYQGTFNEIKLSSSFSNTFDGHWGTIIILALLGTFVVYFFKGLNFTVVDTSTPKSVNYKSPEKNRSAELIKLQQRYDKGEISFEVFQSEWNKKSS